MLIIDGLLQCQPPDMATDCGCQEERAAGNPVASLIRSLALERNRITLALPDWLEEGMPDGEPSSEDSADEDGPPAPALASVALPCYMLARCFCLQLCSQMKLSHALCV